MSPIIFRIKSRPVTSFYALVLVISWGGFFLAGGSGLVAGTNWQQDPLFQLAVLALLTGPLIAGLAMTFVVGGVAGIRDLGKRAASWQVHPRWYAVALLTAPVIELLVLLALSLSSSVFLPSVFTADDKGALLVSGILVGLIGGFVEEVGWTGFAIPRMLPRYGVLVTGIIAGVFWGIWHFPQMWWVGSTSYEAVGPALFFPAYFVLAVLQLTAFRILLVWVYDRTKSLLLVVLMHGSYIFSTLFVFAPPTTGIAYLTYSTGFTVALWLTVLAGAIRVQTGRSSLKVSPR